MILGTFRPTYLTDLKYFWQTAQCDVAVFTDHLPFSKGSPINRSAKFPDNQTVLRIPVLHNEKRNTIFQTEIDYHSNWVDKHIKTLHHFFHNLPYAYYYLPEMEELLKTEFNSLGDFLFALHQKLIRWLHLPVHLMRASDTEFKDETENLIALWCTQTHSEKYISQPETFEKQWVDEEKLRAKGISPIVFAPLPDSHLLKNYQSVVILQFLLQFGPEAGFILQQYLPPRLKRND